MDGNEVFFRIKRSTQLRKLMIAYCDRQSVEFNSIAFLFNGCQLHTEQTPDELKMEDGYEINAMLHQTGGGGGGLHLRLRLGRKEEDLFVVPSTDKATMCSSIAKRTCCKVEEWSTGVSRSIPAVAEPPSKEEIKEILNSRAFERSEESENEDHDEDMVVDAAKQGDEVACALVAADALGKASLSTTSVPFQDIADSLQELDMEHYEEEDDVVPGVELIGTGIGDAYYPSNDMDPYLKD
ncbi:Small ubiquitin-related modifier 2 [Camellia lanceoleosa]|uniref:Small ubiquitin-related modifier 2 n=1 Tax=Camellia lanceoleosa TaxID=1840588 RepID=A0ACC0F153_9ERIC|nr:Small ubiquitin-related modifier 2 [Camellia lanceoleosa]